jgi:signal transduction histidine kinase
VRGRRVAEESGFVGIAVEVAADTVANSVSDSGQGMSPEFSSHCFALFVQAERITERAAGGLGIGLAEDRAA